MGHSRSFKVNLTDVGRNPEQGVAVRYNNVDLISETYDDYQRENCKFDDFIHPTPV